MALPVHGRARVFDAIAADTTTVLSSLAGFGFIDRAGYVLLEVVGASTPSFTLDIQGKVDEGGTYTNVPYEQVWQSGAAVTPSVAQLSIADTTRRFYVIPNPPPYLQLKAVRTTGTLTVEASYVSVPWSQALLTTARGGVFVEGPAASGAAVSGNPVLIAGNDEAGLVAVPDVVDMTDGVGPTAAQSAKAMVVAAVLTFEAGGRLRPIANTQYRGAQDAEVAAGSEYTWIPTEAFTYGLAPDAAFDRLRTAGDAAPGLGALNVAPIGGDVTLRASAAMGGSGTSTALDNVGWVKSLVAVLAVTAVPTGGTPTADFYLQTQLPNGSWQDIAHFAQVTGSTTTEVLSWGPVQGNVNGTQAEGAAVTVDNFYAVQTAGLAASTIRHMPLGDSLRMQWVFAAGGSSGDYTFAVTATLRA